MDESIIKPFVNSAVNVIKVMAHTDTEVGKPFVQKSATTQGAVSGIIGMAGDNIDGMMVISFDEPCILSIVNKMLMEKFEALNQDVIDAVGELTNMICGGTKKELSEMGYSINMSTPIMISGGDVHLAQLSKAEVLHVPFVTEQGKFAIEARIEHIDKK